MSSYKVIPWGPAKVGKTTFALSAVEVGPLAVIDNEGRIQWYTEPHPTVAPRAFPYDNPRRVRPYLPMLERNEKLRKAFDTPNPIYLVETVSYEKTDDVAVVFGKDPEIAAIDFDSASMLWKMLAGSREVDDDDAYGRSWGPVYAWDDMFKAKLISCRKHIILIAQMKEKKAPILQPDGKRKMQVVDFMPLMAKGSQHWADVAARLDLDPGVPYPTLEVTDEGTGGQVVRGQRIENPTFAELLALVEGRRG